MQHKFKVGDLAKIVDRYKNHNFKLLTVVRVKELANYDEDGYPEYKCEYLDSHDYWYVSKRDLELVVVEKPKPQFKIGDKAKILGRTGYRHGFTDGSIVTVVNVHSDSEKCPSVVCKGLDGKREIEQIVEVQDLELCVEPKHQFKVGDKVKVVGNSRIIHAFAIGDIINIISIGNASRDLICAGKSKTHGQLTTQIVDYNDVELYVEPKQEESAPFKIGQIVRITSDTQSDHRFDIGEFVRVIEVSKETRVKYPFSYKFERLDGSFKRWVHPTEFEKLPSSLSINDIENSKNILAKSDVIVSIKRSNDFELSENLTAQFPPTRTIIPLPKYRVNPLCLKKGIDYVTIVRKNGLHIKYENIHNPKGYVATILKAKDHRIIAIGINNKIVYQK